MRIIWAGLGLTCVALGALGVFLPLLPTVPFMLLAAFFFGRSSERLHNWLLTHPVFGQHIINWQTRGAISPKAKQMATLSIVFVFCLSLWLGLSTTILVIQAVTLCLVMVFIWSRPNG
jgi:uncharacterized membrane protein YbaN (DUF454 family)